MMCDLGSTMESVLVIDAQATAHSPLTGNQTHGTHVAHLWLQDEASSNWLKVRRIKSTLWLWAPQRSVGDREACRTLGARQHAEQLATQLREQLQPQATGSSKRVTMCRAAGRVEVLQVSLDELVLRERSRG